MHGFRAASCCQISWIKGTLRSLLSRSRSPVPSSFFLEEIRFPSERQVGFWKTASMPDHHGLDAVSFMSRGKVVSSSPLEMIHPMGGNSVDCLDLPRDLFKDSKRNVNFEHHLMRTQSTANCWRSSEQDVASLSKLYGPPASPSVEDKTIALNGGHYENGLFSSSMPDIFNKKLRLPSNDVFADQSVNTTQLNFAEDEAFGSLEEIEAQAIGDLLPDDDDLLSEAIHDHGHVAQSNWADVEDDLFCSVGGMELESDDKFSCKKTSEIDYRGAFNGQERGLVKTYATEIPHGGEPTRTLFVKNIDRNIEDMELRVLFEQYGDVETLYTSRRHHGFIMVSYYDIRAAQNAIKILNTNSIGGQKLDIQFCISKDSPSEKDIGEGVLLVTNLKSSVSDDDLLHIFGVYGEIKEICEIPHKGHHKFIRFYDVRAAEAALLALNRCDIAGKVIKVEPCSLRDSSFSSVQQLTLDPGEEESSRFRKECYSKNLQSECFVPSGLITRVADVCTGLQNGAIQGMRTAFEMQSSSSVESYFHGISSSMPHNLSSSARVAMAGNCSNQSSNCEHRHSLGHTNLSFQSMLAFPEFRDGVISDIHFNSPSTRSAMAMNISPTLATGLGNKTFHRVGSGVHSSHSFEQNESEFNLSGAGSCPPRGHEYIWNSSKTRHHHHPGSMMWKNLPAFMNNIPAHTPLVHGLARGPFHMPNPVLPQHQHVGSEPAMDPLLWDGRRTFTGDATTFYPSSLGNMGCSNCSPLHSLELASHNIFASARVGIPSPQQRGHLFRGRNSVNLMHNSHDAPNRSRRCDLSAGQADSRKQFELDIDRIIRGEDLRTTLMIKNIPNKYTSKMLLATIDEQHKGTYDFIYLPIDFKNKCNVGYAFINMTDPQHIIPLYQVFNGKKWEKFNSEKVAYLAYARIQGKAALIAHFQNSSLMNEDKRCRPILFHSDGPNAGDQEPFPIPVGVNIRSRRSRTNIENHQGCISGSSSEEESSDAISSPSNSTKNLE